ncbi:unnamed protein product [Mucor hiemalis]
MDLRVPCHAINDDSENGDVSSSEFAKHSFNGKLYKDRMKLVIHAKMILNEIILALGENTTTTKDIRICMLQVMGSQAELLSLRLYANVIYVVKSHDYLQIPTTLQSYATTVNEFIEKLSLFKEICLDAG